MSLATCARPGCGKPIEARVTGRPGRYCSDACRAAARRASATEQVRAEHVPAAATETRQRASYRDFGDGDRCPQDSEHGHMYFTDPAKTKQWCPSSRHEGDPWYRRDGLTPLRTTGPEVSPRPSAPDPAGEAEALNLASPATHPDPDPRGGPGGPQLGADQVALDPAHPLAPHPSRRHRRSDGSGQQGLFGP